MTAPVRRARPALGTLVELGLVPPDQPAGEAPIAVTTGALRAGFEAVAEVEAAMSAFLPGSDVGRFNAAPARAALAISPGTVVVLAVARALWWESGGLLDASLGTGPEDWALEERPGGPVLLKRSADVRVDLGGIAKGYAVDRAVEAIAGRMAAAGWPPRCWADAGGDLAVCGVDLEVRLRDESRGGASPWLTLRRGGLATSHFGLEARALLAGGPALGQHVSVAAPSCLLADALTKVVARAGRTDLPVLAAHGAAAWIHASPGRSASIAELAEA